MSRVTERDRRFLERVFQLQREAGWTDVQFAAVLGVRWTLIAQARHRGTLGKALLVAVCDRYPAMRALYFGRDSPTSKGCDADAQGEAVA